MKKHDKCLETRPEKVAIVAMGPTSQDFVKLMNHHAEWKKYPDEVWTINFAGNWCRSDKIFLMDGIRDDEGNINDSGWHEYAKKHIHTPILSAHLFKELPNVVRFPLEQVLNATQELWYGNTVCYALAYACTIGVKEVHMFGCDFAYEYKNINNEGKSQVISNEQMEVIQGIELGHAAVTYWMGICQRFGIQIHLPPTTTLASFNNRHFYGYGKKQPLIKIAGINRSDPTGDNR
jgi:hypothetical protein